MIARWRGRLARLNGWQRLWVLVSVLWALCVLTVSCAIWRNPLAPDPASPFDFTGIPYDWKLIALGQLRFGARAFGAWAVPAFGLYAFGYGVAWVRRGFAGTGTARPE